MANRPLLTKASTVKPPAHDEKARRKVEAAIAALMLALFAEEADSVARHVADNWPTTLQGQPPPDAERPLYQIQALTALQTYDWASWDRLATQMLTPLTDAAKAGADAGAAQAGLDAQGVAGTLSDAAAAYARDRGAEMVGRRMLADGTLTDNPNAIWRIDETTRQAIRDIIEKAVAEGWSGAQVADAIRSATTFNEARAEMVARTEVALALNRGSVAGYRAAGRDKVLIFDGTEFDDPCIEAAGQVWSLDYYEAHPLEHPRCQRTAGSLPSDDPRPVDRM